MIAVSARTFGGLLALSLAGVALCAAEIPPALIQTTADIVRSAPPSDWRTPDPENTVYLELPKGRVVIELAPAFAPRHVDKVQALVRRQVPDGMNPKCRPPTT